jgi:hypothetical protein
MACPSASLFELWFGLLVDIITYFGGVGFVMIPVLLHVFLVVYFCLLFCQPPSALLFSIYSLLFLPATLSLSCSPILSGAMLAYFGSFVCFLLTGAVILGSLPLCAEH